ncbi:MAG: hypothetical protein KOO61_01735 [Spirochaetales bacterium]|nr:hypothetical protein [Spirochaetales bacterium]
MRVTVKATLTVSMVAMFFVALPTHSAELYRSNAVGIRGEWINPDDADPQDPDSPEYLLEISFIDGTEIRRLLNAGEEIQRVEVTREGTTTTEEVFRNDDLENRTVRRDDGVLLHETRYSGGALTERWEYHYEGALLTSREVLGREDVLLYRESYSYWANGTLRSIVKEDESEIRTEYRYKDGRLEEEWVSRPGESERFEFDGAGRLVIRELFADDELTEQEVRLYWGADSGALLKQVVVSSGEQITRRGYDERGRLISERVEESGDMVSELIRTFGEEFLVLEVETDGDGERRWEYQYTEEGERERVAYREDGRLVEVSYLVLDPGDVPDDLPADRMTELFNRGEPILRIYYQGRQRLREEVIRNGEVIRTREFTPAAEGDSAVEDGGATGGGAATEDGDT